MARRLTQAGFEVSAWNRTTSKSSVLADYGVLTADSPSAAVATADVTIVMLSSGPVVESVLFEADLSGRIPVESMRSGSMLIVMSSIPVETCRQQAQRLAALGINYIDAPVSGGEVGAREGTLSITRRPIHTLALRSPPSADAHVHPVPMPAIYTSTRSALWRLQSAYRFKPYIANFIKLFLRDA